MPKADQSKTLKNSHGGYAGRSIIERIQQQVDKLHTKLITVSEPVGSLKYERNNGRYEGMCAALALLRSSSLEHEQEMSSERLGIG